MRSPLRRSCLVAALDAQKLTRVSNVEPISLDGHHGLYVEMRVPRTVDVDRCDDGYYMFWEGKPGDAQHSSPLVQTLCGRLTGMRPEHAGQKAVCHHHSASSLDSMLRRLVRAHSSQ